MKKLGNDSYDRYWYIPWVISGAALVVSTLTLGFSDIVDSAKAKAEIKTGIRNLISWFRLFDNLKV